MTNAGWLTKILKWMFAVFAVAAGLSTVFFCVLWLLGPNVPPDLRLGPYNVHILGQPGTIVLQNSMFDLSALRGNVHLRVDQAQGLVETLRHYGLPVLILKTAFFALLFELLRRLFRNVGRGESFTRQTVRLVQITGLSLLVFSLVLSAGESWFGHGMYSYLSQHAMLQIAGTPLRLPAGSHGITFDSGSFPFGTPLFFSGLLVLALSEVFRQGLALKSENDLTV